MFRLSFQYGWSTVIRLIRILYAVERNKFGFSAPAGTLHRKLFYSVAILTAFLMASCNSPIENTIEESNCQSAEGNLLWASVDGEPFCADFVSDGPIAPGYHQIVGSTVDGQRLHILFPLKVGDYLLDLETGIGGSYLPDVDGNISFLTAGEGGWIIITELSEDYVRGSFDFVAYGIEQDTAVELDTLIVITEGSFDIRLKNR